MAKPRIDFGKLTEDETLAVALDALEELDPPARIQVVLKTFDSRDDRLELIVELQDANDEDA